MDVHDYAETRATGKLGRHTVFELVCRHVAKVARLGDEEREVLKKLQKFLRLPPEEARGILERAREDEAASSRRDELSGEEVFEQACELAWSDGPLEERELKLLKGLASVMRLDAAAGQRILDATYEGSFAAMQDAAEVARQEEPGEEESGTVSVSLTDAGPPESAARQQESVQLEPEARKGTAAWGKRPVGAKGEREAASGSGRSPSPPSSGGLGVLPGLVRGVFTEPQETLIRAGEPECRFATLFLLLAFSILQVVFTVIVSGKLVFSILLVLTIHAALYLALLFGGTAAGGEGKPLPLLQLFGLVLPAMFLVEVVASTTGLSLLGNLFHALFMGYVLRVGHRFERWGSVGLAYGFGWLIFLFVGGPLVTAIFELDF